jgi:Ca2+-binding RTX toxin-like protein
MGFYSEQDPLQVTNSPELPEDGGGEFVDPATDYIAVDSAVFADSAEIKFKSDTPVSRLLARPEVFVKGTNASETLQGKKGKTNSISGLGGDDVLLGMNSGDILSGGSGNDQLDGGGSGDFLYGDAGQDTLKGGAGQDYLQGDGGKDVLMGGAGSDEFAIQKGKGRDIIADYRDGVDKLATFNVSFPDLTISQQGADTVLRTGGGTIAILQNVKASTITVDDFVIPLPVLV